MQEPPIVAIDLPSFWEDPYPKLRDLQRSTPICFAPQLNAILFTRRDDIAECEKNIEVFSSEQPEGLMTRLMGHNMMRKDGEPHQTERKQAFPSFSPRTVRDHWKAQFVDATIEVLDGLAGRKEFDLVKDYAMPVSAHALRNITGLTTMSTEEMDSASQGMIDGVSNYAGDAEIERRCHAATSLIDHHIDLALKCPQNEDAFDMVSVLSRSGQADASLRANVKLAISGGQNEPRDAIAGAVFALLKHPEQLNMALTGEVPWLQVFEEYARWMSPIGMSPREIAQESEWKGNRLEKGKRVFFMFGAANRDETIFDHPDRFDVTRDTGRAISFGAGPHFCAGAAASRSLIADVALPMLFERLPDIRLDGDVPFGGWAFRGPLKMPVAIGG